MHLYPNFSKSSLKYGQTSLRYLDWASTYGSSVNQIVSHTTWLLPNRDVWIIWCHQYYHVIKNSRPESLLVDLYIFFTRKTISVAILWFSFSLLHCLLIHEIYKCLIITWTQSSHTCCFTKLKSDGLRVVLDNMLFTKYLNATQRQVYIHTVCSQFFITLIDSSSISVVLSTT